MRILDTDANTALKNIILYLKREEAKELYDSLGLLLKDNDLNSHSHVADILFDHEVTVLLYDEQNIEMLNERSKKIVVQDV